MDGYFCPRLKGKVLVVHASLTSKQRELVASMLRSNQLIIAIATSAFEMGIDCKLRRVIFYDDGGTQLRSIESHMQRDGRIGRDKDDIECEILSIFTFLSIPKDQKIAENTKSIRKKTESESEDQKRRASDALFQERLLRYQVIFLLLIIIQVTGSIK